MDAIEIGDDETKLLKAVREGKPADLEGARIPAELIRRIVLGLPFAGDEADSIWGDVRRLFGKATQSCECPRTPVGIWLRDAVIVGSLNLGSATGEEGGPMCPLAFESCRFEAGLVGAHGRFSRLSFTGCTFVDSGEGEAPTIDLSGAAIDSDLQMRGIRPYGIPANGVGPHAAAPNYLRVKLKGVRVDGAIDLCHSHLRARRPDGRSRPLEISDDGNDALDLALAEVKGDIQFLWGISEGRIKIRAAHIAGDVWMTGATLDNPHEGWLRGQALTMQGSRVDGFLMLDGGPQNMDGSGRFRTFRCRGVLKLEAAEVGRSLYLQDAIVRGTIEGPHVCVRDDFVLHAEVTRGIDLSGARIGGTFDLSKLNLASPVKRVSLKDLCIGRTLKVAQPDVPYRLLGARETALPGLRPLKLVETLWRLAPGGKDEREEDVPLARRLVQVAFLVDDTHPRDVRIFHLDGHADVIRRALERCRPRNPLSAAERRAMRKDIVSVRNSYLLRSDGFRGGDESACRLENGFILPPRVSAKYLRGVVGRFGWFADSGLGEATDYEPHRKTKERFAHHVEAHPLLQGDFDLEGTACELLDDRGGKAWGEHLDRIRINHFAYRRWSWIADARPSRTESGPLEQIGKWLRRYRDWARLPAGKDYRPEAAAKSRRARLGHFARAVWRNRPTGRGHADDVVQTKSRRSSFHWLRDRLKGAQADWLWPFTGGRKATRLREESDYLEPWQLRRNWIYRQFTPLPKSLEGLVSVSRYLFAEDAYRPQPFEQAVLVARAEGREDVAVSFEMLKRRIEWRLFNNRIRWLLAGPAIVLGAAWLLDHGGRWVPTLIALAGTVFMMTFVSWLDALLCRLPWVGRRLRDWRRVRHALRELILYVPALSLLFLLDRWWDEPFHFIVALLIFIGIRFISVLAHAWMRFGFGYLRRPVRAINMLIVAFLIGWGWVSLANRHDMLVVAMQPTTASVAAPNGELEYRYPKVPLPEGTPLLSGTTKVDHGPDFIAEVSCRPTLSEPLYALDVLIPLVDLHEESRCEVRRVRECAPPSPPSVPHAPPLHAAEPQVPPAPASHKSDHSLPSCPDRNITTPSEMRFSGLWHHFAEFTIKDHKFWWWMKALYAVAGWFIVSLALLTFAQVNRTHGEAAEAD